MSEENNIGIICRDAKAASRVIASLSTPEKNRILSRIIINLEKNKKKIYDANKLDIEESTKNGMNSAMIQRLKIDDHVFNEMIDGIKTVIKLEEPVHKILEKKKLKNGLLLSKVSVPIGTIMIIYESRPNVTIDVSTLCIKSGNAVILKGGKEAVNSNLALFECIRQALPDKGIVQYVKDRETVASLLKRNDSINLIIPRGGKGLVKSVVENSTIPVIKHYEGICNIYVDKKADLKKAIEIIVNAKVQKPSACNAVENLLVHSSIADIFLPIVKKELEAKGVELRGCEETRKVIEIKAATEEDFRTEYLALILSIKIVSSCDEAIDFIAKYSSSHSDAIITEDKKAAGHFLKEVDSAAVYHNASTRFTDGGQFGLGCEMGISTDKLHARGPMGLKELTSYKYLIKGNGHVRK